MAVLTTEFTSESCCAASPAFAAATAGMCAYRCTDKTARTVGPPRSWGMRRPLTGVLRPKTNWAKPCDL